MAIDQSLLETTARTGQGVLRFYRWAPATLSIGYFQKLADRQLHTASQSCPIVRRASGGGAIVHDDELTYSFCMATKGSIARADTGLYDLVHAAICRALAEQQIETTLYDAPVDSAPKASQADPFLCFQRRAVGDIICDGAKVGGSAQRRLKNSLIQHGSLLLSQSSNAPELPGLKELSGIEVDVDQLQNRLTSLLSEGLGLEFVDGELSAEEVERAKEIEAEKFGAACSVVGKALRHSRLSLRESSAEHAAATFAKRKATMFSLQSWQPVIDSLLLNVLPCFRAAF